MSLTTNMSTSEQALHKAWGYAKEHPEECSDGYDKKAFIHVQYWILQEEKNQPKPIQECHACAATDDWNGEREHVEPPRPWPKPSHR